MPFSISLISAVVVQLLCQIFKVAYYSARGRRLRIGYLFAAGGMPSGHAAFVTALTVSVGLSSGFRSEAFALAFVFSMIIVYDILRIRSVVQRHSEMLDRIVAAGPAADREGAPGAGLEATRLSSLFALPRRIGHTPAEVAVGVVVGAAFAAAAWRLFAR